MRRKTFTKGFLFATCAACFAGLMYAEDLPLEKPAEYGGWSVYAFHPNGQTVVVGTNVGTIRDGTKIETFGGEIILWSTKTGKITKTLKGHKGKGADWLAFDAAGDTLASGAFDDANSQNGAGKLEGEIKIWDVRGGGKLLQTIDLKGVPMNSGGNFHRIALAPRGDTVYCVLAHQRKVGNVTITEGGDVVAWDARSGVEGWRIRNSSVAAIALNPSGRQLYAFTEKGEWEPDGSDGASTKSVDYGFATINAATGKMTPLESEIRSSPKLLTFIPGIRSEVLVSADNKGLYRVDPTNGEQTLKVKWDKKRWAYSSLAVSSKAVARGYYSFVEVLDLRSGNSLALEEFDRTSSFHSTAFSQDLTQVVGTRKGPMLKTLTLTP